MSPLSETEQQTLLRMAREAVTEAVQHHRLPEIPEPVEALRQPCGAFVTLRKGKRLRGCIGYIEAVKPLFSTVRECAVAAALNDPRFPPLTFAELPKLSLEISVLSPLTDIAPVNVEVGKHGLLVSLGYQRGLLLPQVAVEWKWNRERFLQETCLKAGLPPDAWQHGAKIRAFTAQLFEEPDPTHSPAAA
jgi:AmmeMemoRadiSam system protein A